MVFYNVEKNDSSEKPTTEWPLTSESTTDFKGLEDRTDWLRSASLVRGICPMKRPKQDPLGVDLPQLAWCPEAGRTGVISVHGVAGGGSR